VRDVTFSYAELNIRSNRLARHLITLGAGPEQLVTIAIPRSADLIVAVLAVLKTGAGYMPVDPGYPPERIGFMVADTSPVAVLTTAGSGLGLRGAVPRVVLDDPATMAAVSRLAGGDLGEGERLGVP
jgi:non-ribosomal peptide synthetase component F